ncbi:ATP-dependent zinc metalloprotease FtsH [Nitratireductor aquimarinus]|uniref:ATP-dependent zinc metalloprotease FtsH n=1 Tax=Nitratireductor aquimarinus TaxID=889300 RepID=UPI001A8E551D|nr:ATP-dependent zinc metalloprotease FtsH [Nitratireductor aquimarinus]MBN8245709.1 ATP-dependent zinc metalloprotease FtsH [Nitratireductor aquimarinus]MBY6134090.1 ATP-dependent zinc metalloprotease FtsH [Nitratireductor aquimarinus]MCA1305186.1 ATP-dependent zinc metalloprotease FtsH [Nitratireductor aquimarinus]
MEKKTEYNIWYWVVAFVAVLFLQNAIAGWRSVAPINFSQFQTYLEDGKIESVTVGRDTISGRFTVPVEGKNDFVTTIVDPSILQLIDKKGVEITGVPQNTFLGTLISWVAPALVFFGIWMLLFRKFADRQGFGGFMQVGKSKAKVYMEKETGVSFADVAGVDEAKAELEEVVQFLRNPADYGKLGARIPKGILLVGPPGTGKTLLARAVAGEAGVTFFSISGSEFVEMFVGVGAARVRDLFEQARTSAPAMIFIDELDALGRARAAGQVAGGHDEREQTLNQLLTELDGFDPSADIVLLAATNRPEILDPALLRAGRFDRQVLVDKPDKTGRVQILNVHMKKVTLAPDVDAEKVAALTPGFSGADLANLVNEAALLATRRKAAAVGMEDFTNAVERIVAGLEKKNRLLNPREREIVAHHEMGHALVAMALPGVDPVHKVSIIPRGIGALGYTIQRPTEDRFLMTREELENKIAVLLGGRAAEKVIYDHLSTGAADDLVKATDIARAMVARYGMDPDLGHVSYDSERPGFLGTGDQSSWLNRRYSDATAERMDAKVRDIVDGVFERTVALLTANRALLDETAQRLLEKETLDETDLAEVQGKVQPARNKAV